MTEPKHGSQNQRHHINMYDKNQEFGYKKMNTCLIDMYTHNANNSHTHTDPVQKYESQIHSFELCCFRDLDITEYRNHIHAPKYMSM